MHTEHDVVDLIDRYESEYGSFFTDMYSVDMALSDFELYGYEYIVHNVLAVADELNGERWEGLD